jgi:hypothetical protein
VPIFLIRCNGRSGGVGVHAKHLDQVQWKVWWSGCTCQTPSVSASTRFEASVALSKSRAPSHSTFNNGGFVLLCFLNRSMVSLLLSLTRITAQNVWPSIYAKRWLGWSRCKKQWF